MTRLLLLAALVVACSHPAPVEPRCAQRFGDWSPLEGIYDPEALCEISWGFVGIRLDKDGPMEFWDGKRFVSLNGGRDAFIRIDQDESYGFCWPDFPVDERENDSFARAHRYSPREFGKPPTPQPSEYLREHCPEPRGVDEEALRKFGEALRKAALP